MNNKRQKLPEFTIKRNILGQHKRKHRFLYILHVCDFGDNDMGLGILVQNDHWTGSNHTYHIM